LHEKAFPQILKEVSGEEEEEREEPQVSQELKEKREGRLEGINEALNDKVETRSQNASQKELIFQVKLLENQIARLRDDLEIEATIGAAKSVANGPSEARMRVTMTRVFTGMNKRFSSLSSANWIASTSGANPCLGKSSSSCSSCKAPPPAGRPSTLPANRESRAGSPGRDSGQPSKANLPKNSRPFHCRIFGFAVVASRRLRRLALASKVALDESSPLHDDNVAPLTTDL